MAIQSVGSSLAPRRLIAWIFMPKARISRAVATPTLPKPRMPQTAAAQHLVGAALVEFAALQIGVLDKQTLCGGQRQRDDVLGHRLGAAALVGGDRQLRRQVAGRHPIDAGGGELQ